MRLLYALTRCGTLRSEHKTVQLKDAGQLRSQHEVQQKEEENRASNLRPDAP